MTSHSNQFAHVDSDLNFHLQSEITWNVIWNKTWFINKQLSCLWEIRQAYKSGKTGEYWGRLVSPLVSCGTCAVLRDFPFNRRMTVLLARTRGTWERQTEQGEPGCRAELCGLPSRPRGYRGEEAPRPGQPSSALRPLPAPAEPSPPSRGAGPHLQNGRRHSHRSAPCGPVPQPPSAAAAHFCFRCQGRRERKWLEHRPSGPEDLRAVAERLIPSSNLGGKILVSFPRAAGEVKLWGGIWPGLKSGVGAECMPTGWGDGQSWSPMGGDCGRARAWWAA